MRRAPRRVDPGYLRRVAIWYLERWDGSRDSVRRTLRKRVERAVRAHEQDREEMLVWVEAVLDELEAGGLIDDRRYAEATIARLRDRGSSTRKIRTTLAVKGIDRDLVGSLLDEAASEGPPPERIAAIRYARRRRFGPWRRPSTTPALPPKPSPPKPSRPKPDVFTKELASMARAGFDLGLARTILNAPDKEALEDELPIGW